MTKDLHVTLGINTRAKNNLLKQITANQATTRKCGEQAIGLEQLHSEQI
jgi:hypothetical protein